MNLACTMAPGRGDTDLILARLATDLATRGLKLCGTVQIGYTKKLNSSDRTEVYRYLTAHRQRIRKHDIYRSANAIAEAITGFFKADIIK